MQPQSSYTIPEFAVDKLAALGQAMLSLAQEIRQHQSKRESTTLNIPIPTLLPPSHIPSEEAWFWSEEWQTKEQEANEALHNGDYIVFNSAEELLADLHRHV